MPNDIHISDLDSTDRKILAALQSDGRMTNAHLAKKVGLSPAACHTRVRTLERSGIIAAYVALLDPKATGRAQSIFVQITLNSQSRKELSEFERQVVKSAHVRQCHLMTGDYDYLLELIVRDSEEYEKLHHDFLTCLPNVARINSSFALRTVRRTTVTPL